MLYKCVAVTTLLCVTSLLLIGCGPNVDPATLAPIPSVNTSVLDNTVKNQISKALDDLQERPLKSDLNGRAGMVLHVYRFRTEADALYSRARALDPDEVRWPYYQALVKQKLGDLDTAYIGFQQALELAPKNTIIHVALADALIELGKEDEAQTYYEKLTLQFPDRAEVWHGYGRFLRQSANYEKSIEAYQKVIEIEGHFSPAYFGIAQNYQQMGNVEQAEHYLGLRTLYQNRPITVRDELGEELRRLDNSITTRQRVARNLVRAGRTKEAIDLLNTIHRDDPENISASISLIGLYTSVDNHEKVKYHHEIAKKNGLDRPKLHFNMGTYYLKNGLFYEARDAFMRAVKLSPEDPDILVRLGMAYEKLQDNNRAQQQFSQALSKDANHREANFLLGRQYSNQKQFDKALPLLVKAAQKKDKRQATYLNVLARMQALSGDMAAAAISIEQAAELIDESTNPELAKRIRSDLTRIQRAVNKLAP